MLGQYGKPLLSAEPSIHHRVTHIEFYFAVSMHWPKLTELRALHAHHQSHPLPPQSIARARARARTRARARARARARTRDQLFTEWRFDLLLTLLIYVTYTYMFCFVLFFVSFYYFYCSLLAEFPLLLFHINWNVIRTHNNSNNSTNSISFW